VLKKSEDVIARSEATPAYPNRGRRSNLLLFMKREIASLPEPALSATKGPLAMTPVSSFFNNLLLRNKK
jgi:hypothetical protein